jgi:hypothetical protein
MRTIRHGVFECEGIVAENQAKDVCLNRMPIASYVTVSAKANRRCDLL